MPDILISPQWSTFERRGVNQWHVCDNAAPDRDIKMFSFVLDPFLENQRGGEGAGWATDPFAGSEGTARQEWPVVAVGCVTPQKSSLRV